MSHRSAECVQDFGNVSLVGASQAFAAVVDFIRRFATCEAPVLILGETGTGKELVARALHYLSTRSARAFVPMNCGAVPDQLFENELFGHERGAYTDARLAQKGLVAQAQGGALFLDEIDSLSCKGQVALLRFLQDRQYRPLGSHTVYTADIRVIAATNSDLKTLIKDGQFRQDLFFRLDVVSVTLPPLRRRRDDIPILAAHFLRRFAGLYGLETPKLDAAAEAEILSYSWPGNVRELENAMHRAVLTAEHDTIKGPLGLQSHANDTAAGLSYADIFQGGLRHAKARCLMEFERRYLDWLLLHTRGNVSAAARHAAADRRQLGRLIRRHGIDLAPYRAG